MEILGVNLGLCQLLIPLSDVSLSLGFAFPVHNLPVMKFCTSIKDTVKKIQLASVQITPPF